MSVLHFCAQDTKIASLERNIRDLEDEIQMLKANGLLNTEDREEEIKQMEVYKNHSKFMKTKVRRAAENTPECVVATVWTDTQVDVSLILAALTSGVIRKVSSWQKTLCQEQQKRQNQQNEMKQRGLFFKFIYCSLSSAHQLSLFSVYCFYKQIESKRSCPVVPSITLI